MQGYNKTFARAYNLLWTDFADRAAPRILDYYQNLPTGGKGLPVLDLCCGTGTMALHFLAAGFPVVGVDLSPHMLGWAREAAREYIEAGRARFIEADASGFEVEQGFGLAVSTYDSLNHLDSLDSLRSCFERTLRALMPGGVFVFDLNTRMGLRHWSEVSFQEDDEVVVMKLGAWDEYRGQAFYKASGFLRVEGGLYERFEEVVVEQAFEIAAVRDLLLKVGFTGAYCAQALDLTTPVSDPEGEDRVFFVAGR